MPRVTRGVADGVVCHVLNRGNGRQRVFHKDGDFAAFVELLGKARARHPVKIFSDCLIPNHFRLLLQADAGAEQFPLPPTQPGKNGIGPRHGVRTVWRMFD